MSAVTALGVLGALACAAWFLLANIVPLAEAFDRRAAGESSQRALETISWLPLIVLAVALFVAVIWP